MPRQYTSLSPETRFWKQVHKTSDCWLWTGAPTWNGYGRIGYLPGGGGMMAHRFSYLMHVGPIPDGLQVCHHCDVRACVRPDHLFLGTQADNMHDMVSKDRQARGESHGSRVSPERLARGERHGSRTHPDAIPRGEDHARSKLTDEAVRDIRASYGGKRGELPMLANRHGVTKQLVWMVLRGKIWRHVD